MTSTTQVFTAMEVDEERHQPLPVESTDLQISTTFSVAEEAGEIEIKQEPEEYIPEVLDEHEQVFENEITDDNLTEVYPEINDSILQRAVSPPSYNDLDEQSIEELALFYRDKYNLKDVSVLLESCDKIWETLQLIKNLQGYTNEDQESNSISPKNPPENQIELSGLLNIEPPRRRCEMIGRPDFRYTGNKKKVFNCVTCNKLFTNFQSFKSHAVAIHKVFYKPKRMYKMREIVSRPNSTYINSSVSSGQSKSKVSDELIKNDVPKVKTQNTSITTSVIQTRRTSTQLPETTVPSNLVPLKNEIKPQESKPKSSGSRKIKCVLCRRICTDIKYHLKVFHKVGCLSSIIDKCEILNDDGTWSISNQICDELMSEFNSSPVNDSSELLNTPDLQSKKQAQMESDNNIHPEPQSQPESEEKKTEKAELEEKKNVGQDLKVEQVMQKPPESQLKLQTLAEIKPKFQPNIQIKPTRVVRRKRRGVASCWTQKKRKVNKVNLPKAPVLYNIGPFKCNICLGIYKTYKSFSHHRKLHHMRGETPQNFNPYLSRFLNSPLRPLKDKVETVNSENSEMEVVDDSTTAQVVDLQENDLYKTSYCACGQMFRRLHTFMLHKVQCSKANEDSSSLNNDLDPALGISIKIKKNKNDSYEVVTRNAVEESCKEIKSSKDSDISSNDSGVVSTDSNNQKVDLTDGCRFSHSIFRVQREDHDEEVDIEDDENSNRSISNTDSLNDALETINTHPKSNISNAVKPLTRKNGNIPSLSNLCKQVLSQSNPSNEQLNEQFGSTQKYKTKCACGKTFKNFKYFNIHVRRVHPNLLKCSYCMTNFDRVEKYFEHKCEVTEGKLFIEPIIQTQCLQCNELVDIEEPFDKHMKIHDDNLLNFHCFKCEFKFENEYQRKAHFDKEHGSSSCQVCGKVLHIEHLSKHEAYHDGLGYPCHLCKKAFTQKVLLKKHVQNIHDPLVNELVKCLVCSKSMKLKYLKKHMSIHLHSEICKKCNKCSGIGEQNDVNNHAILDHLNDDTPHKCGNGELSSLTEKKNENCNGSIMSNGKLSPIQDKTE